MNIAEFKARYPAYKDVDDVKLADALHRKYYSSIPRDQFMQQVGVGVAQVPDDTFGAFKEPAKAALGGLEATGSILTQIPGMLAGGVAGAGTAALTGGNLDAASAVMEGVQERIPSYQPQSDYGKLTMQGLQALKETAGDVTAQMGNRPLPAHPGEVPFWLANKIGGEALGRGAGEVMADLAIGIPAIRLGPRRGVSPQGRDYLNQRQAQQQPTAPQPQQGPTLYSPEEIEAEFAQRQGELPLDRLVDPGQGPLPYTPDVVPMQDMRGQVQGDLFDRNPQSYPAQQRTDTMRQEAESMPYEGATLAEEPLSSMEPTAPFRQEDLDFPLRQEAIDKDPYIKTLKEEAEKAYKENQRILRWMKSHGQTVNMLKKAEETAARVDEVTRLAKEYLLNAYRVSKPDHYSGSMWMDKPTQIPIERSGTRNTSTTNMSQVPGVNLPDTRGNKVTQKYTIEKTPTWSGTPRGRQRGAINVEEITKAIDDLAKKITGLEAKLEGMTPALREKAESRLEAMYYAQMKNHHALEAIEDPSHPLHTWYKEHGTAATPPKPSTKQLKEQPIRKGWQWDPKKGRWNKVSDNDPFKGPGKKQAGAINFEGFKKEMTDPTKVDMEAVRDRIYKLNAMLGDSQYRSKAELKPIRDELSRLLRLERDLSEKRIAEIRRKIGGPGKKEQGAIFTKDPEFERFRSELPPHLKKEAKALYKEWKRMQEPRQPDVMENEDAVVVVDNIMDKDWTEQVGLINKTPEEIKAIVVKEPDGGKGLFTQLGKQMVSGAKLLGFGTQNTLVRWVAQQTDRVMRRTAKNIEEYILNEHRGLKPKWDSLKGEEKAVVWAELLTQEGKMDLTREQMFEKGWTEKMVDAAEAMRRGLDAVYARLNEARSIIGKGPVDWRAGYIPSRFRGDWTIRARDAEGKLIHIVGENSKAAAERAKKMMEEKFPDLKFDDVKHEPLHRFADSSDVTIGYQAFLDILKDEDPRVAALESVFEDYLKKQAYNTLSVKKHFWDKRSVQGFEGAKEWKDGITNAEEGLRSVMNYMDHAFKWAEAQVELKPVRSLLKDKEVQQAQKNTVAWAQAYIDQALGRTPKMARHLDAIVDLMAEHTGIGQSLGLKAIRDTKYFVTALYLGFMNFGFSLSQILQVMQTVPAWMVMLKSKGAEANILGAYARGAIDATKGFVLGKDNMSPIGREAWQYAKEMGIVEPKILDDVKDWRDRSMNQKLDHIATWNMTYFERMARSQAFLSWVHFLDETKQFKSNKEIFETAANLTDMTMVDYRGHERPMVYKQFGMIGEMANALTTFKHNYFTQMWALGKHRKSAGIGPEATFYTLMLTFGGLLGMPGREEIDGLIRLLNKVSPSRIPTTRELFLEHLPDAVSFGGLSTLSGLDLSSKFSAANIIPDSALTAAFPFAGTITDAATALGQFTLSPNHVRFWRLLDSISPLSGKGVTETYGFTDSKGMTVDKKNLEGKRERTTKDKTARFLSLRSMEESKQMHTDRTRKEQDEWMEDKRASLIERANEARWSGDTEEIKRLAQEYVKKYEGKPENFVSQLLEKAKDQRMTPEQRAKASAINNPERLKRLMGQ